MSKFPEIDPGVRVGGQPTEHDLAEMKQQGIQTVIDFRQPGEIAPPNESLAAGQGLEYVNIPINRANPSESAVQQLDEVLRQKEGPHLLHCGTGIRAITIYLLRQARAQGWSAEQTMQEAQKRGFDLRGAADLSGFVRRYLENGGSSTTPS